MANKAMHVYKYYKCTYKYILYLLPSVFTLMVEGLTQSFYNIERLCQILNHQLLYKLMKMYTN